MCVSNGGRAAEKLPSEIEPQKRQRPEREIVFKIPNKKSNLLREIAFRN